MFLTSSTTLLVLLHACFAGGVGLACSQSHYGLWLFGVIVIVTAHNVEGGGTYNGLEREHAHRYLYPVPIDNIDCKMNASDEKLRDGRKDLLFSTPFIASRARRIVAARRTMPVVCIAE